MQSCFSWVGLEFVQKDQIMGPYSVLLLHHLLSIHQPGLVFSCGEEGGGGGGGRWLALNKTAGEEIFLWGNFSCSLYCLNLYGFLMSTRFMNQRGKLKFHLLISVFRWTICGSLEGGWHLCAWIEYWWAPPDGNHLDFYSMVLISWLEDEWTAWNVESPCLPSCLRRWRTRRDPMCLKEDAGGWHWPRKAHILGISGSSIV